MLCRYRALMPRKECVRDARKMRKDAVRARYAARRRKR